MSVYFVSGIDTGIGKTIATGMIARYLIQHGCHAITMKLVQTGNVGFSEDLDAHRKIMQCGRFPEDELGLTTPAIFAFPASPHLAASREGTIVDIPAIRSAVNTLASKYEVVLLEGAGGLAVPLTEDLLTVDFIAQENYPLILVASGRLGSLNHAILSIEVATHRGITIAGVVYNWCDEADPEITADTKRMILKYLKKHHQPEVLIEIGKIGSTYPNLDFGPIFKA